LLAVTPFTTMPSTFVLPAQRAEFEFALRTAAGETPSRLSGPPPEPLRPTLSAEPDPETNLWIFKPVSQSRGRGIHITRTVAEALAFVEPLCSPGGVGANTATREMGKTYDTTAMIHTTMTTSSGTGTGSTSHGGSNPNPNPNPERYDEKYVVQRYVADPLLVHGRKFDLRIYVLVTSFAPLEAWVYTEGFARFSMSTYNVNAKDMNVHLTNAALQRQQQHPPGVRGGGDGEPSSASTSTWKTATTTPSPYASSTFSSSSPEEEIKAAWRDLEGGSKVPLSRLWDDLSREDPNTWTTDGRVRQSVWKRIREVIWGALIATSETIPSSPGSFEVLGFDIMLDAQRHVWLIEVNSSPSMELRTPLDRAVKPRMIHDALCVLQPVAFDRLELATRLLRRTGLGGSRQHERSKGIFARTSTGERHETANDVMGILGGGRPRRVGEDPVYAGLWERLTAPSGGGGDPPPHGGTTDIRP
jgi:hypothetical protein